MSKLYFRMLSGSVRMKTGSPKLLKRGMVVPDGLADGELQRLKDRGAVVTEAAWNAGEKQPHHLRPPHRGQMVDPRAAGAAQAKATEAATDAGTLPDPDAPMPPLGELDDAALRALWDSKPPLVSDLVEAVGDDAELAMRVMEAEETASGGQPRKTLMAQLNEVIDA